MSETKTPKILEYLKAMEKQNASDLYLTAGFPPTFRCEKELVKPADDPLKEDTIQEMVNSILTSRQRREFTNKLELNTALDLGKHGRFRVNILSQKQKPAMVIRRIDSEIPSFADLKLPKVLGELALEKRGLVLVTGVTGSGKSTTLAAMIDYRNQREEGHIITIEDPIEYFHDHKKSVITQREVGVDTESYANAMKNSLRQRPDVILVGEIRDREVMEQALAIAETGHLCLATIHTNNAYQAIERIVNLFPEDYHNQIRLNLSLNLKAIISQRLLPSIQGGMVPAVEIMLNQGLVRDLIVKGNITKIGGVMEQNNALGMCTFEQSLFMLYKKGLIDEDNLILNSDRASDMKVKIRNHKLTAKSLEEENHLKSMDTSLLSLYD